MKDVSWWVIGTMILLLVFSTAKAYKEEYLGAIYLLLMVLLLVVIARNP